MNKVLALLLVFGLLLFGCPHSENSEETTQYVYSDGKVVMDSSECETMKIEEEIQEKSCLVANTTDELFQYMGLNCTPVTYSKQRESYNVNMEVLGFDDDGWCRVSYNYAPNVTEEAESPFMPSTTSVSGVWIAYNTNESKKDHSDSNIETGLQFGYLIIAEKFYEDDGGQNEPLED